MDYSSNKHKETNISPFFGHQMN